MTDLSAALKYGALTAFLLVGIVACQPTSTPATASLVNGDTATLQNNTQAFAQETAIAAFYAQRCEEQGIALAGGSSEAASQAFFTRMTAAGYSRSQIETASASVDTSATGQAAVSYLEGRGLQAGADANALCQSAQVEIEQGTAVGRLLVS